MAEVWENGCVDRRDEIVVSDQLYSKYLPVENSELRNRIIGKWNQFISTYSFDRWWVKRTVSYHNVDHQNVFFAYDKQDPLVPRNRLLRTRIEIEISQKTLSVLRTCFRLMRGDFLVKCCMKVNLIFLDFSSVGVVTIECERID